jgi:hypothetical protein
MKGFFDTSVLVPVFRGITLTKWNACPPGAANG